MKKLPAFLILIMIFQTAAFAHPISHYEMSFGHALEHLLSSWNLLFGFGLICVLRMIFKRDDG